MSGEVAVRESTAVMRIDAQALIAQAIEKGASIEMLERLVGLAERMQASMALKAYRQAVAQFQRDCPAIKKTRKASIMTRGGGSYEYSYAELDQVLAVVQPVLAENGLSVSWDTGGDANSVTAECILSHADGHSERSGKMTVPIHISVNDAGATPAQRVGIARTYACRYTLLNIIGKSPERDLDGQGASSGERPTPSIRRPPRPSEPAPRDDVADTVDQVAADVMQEERDKLLIQIGEVREGLDPAVRDQLKIDIIGYGKIKDAPIEKLKLLLAEAKSKSAEAKEAPA